MGRGKGSSERRRRKEDQKEKKKYHGPRKKKRTKSDEKINADQEEVLILPKNAYLSIVLELPRFTRANYDVALN